MFYMDKITNMSITLFFVLGILTIAKLSFNVFTSKDSKKKRTKNSIILPTNLFISFIILMFIWIILLFLVGIKYTDKFNQYSLIIIGSGFAIMAFFWWHKNNREKL